MKNIFLIIFMLVTVSLWSQAPLLFSSRLNVTNVTGSDPYTLTGVVQDELSLWSAADINATADSIYHLEGSDLLIYRITSISSAIGNNFVIIVDDIMNSGLLPSTGNEWAAIEFTPNYQFPSYIGNLSSPFKAVIDNRFKQRLDLQLVKDSLLYQENTTTRATSDNTDNYHKGNIGIGDFSTNTIQAKLHLYDVAQAILRISDAAASDTAAIAYIDFWRGHNDSRLGRFGYLFNTDADLYVSNESTGGGLRLRTNATDKLYISPGGALMASQYGIGNFSGTTAKVLTVDAAGNILDDKTMADFSTNTGNVLYVSKAGWKGTGTEELGNPAKPWKTPWTARAAATDGDKIHVFKDTYTITNAAGGGDKEVTVIAATSDTTTNLYFNGTWYFETGARIVSTATADNPVLFFPTKKVGSSCRILGHGSFIDSGATRYLNFFEDQLAWQPNDRSIALMVEADSIIANRIFFSNDSMEFVDVKIGVVKASDRIFQFINKTDKMSFSCNTLETNGTGADNIVISNSNPGCSMAVDITNFTVGGTAKVGGTFEYKLGDKLTANINVENVLIASGSTWNTAYGKLFGHQSTGSLVNSVINFNYGTITDLADTSQLFSFGSGNWDTTAIHINCDNIYTLNGKLLKYSVSDADQFSVFLDVGNYQQDNSRYALQISGTSTLGEFYFDGNYVTEGIFSHITGTNKNMVFSGRYETVGVGFQTDSNISFQDAVIKSGASAPVGNISSAVSINCMNVFSNSTVIDSDVTEVIQNIVRNSNVK